MTDTLPDGLAVRLERSCKGRRSDWVRSERAAQGVQLLQAWFGGRAYDPHRHDTYAIGLTDVGVQAFDYRGVTEVSTAGRVVVLHPDETHDGRAGTPGGFGYRIVYVAPTLIRDAARALCGRPCALPFVREPVAENAALAHAIEAAFRYGLEPLAVDRLVLRLAEALVDADPSCGRARSTHVDEAAVERARRFLDSETTRVVRSSELEAVAGLSRYDLARQFRTVLGTSPYRYSLMRRLDFARAELLRSRSTVDVALAAGFADQAHFGRMFKSTFGVAPARYRALIGRAAAAQPRRASGQKRMPSRA